MTRRRLVPAMTPRRFALVQLAMWLWSLPIFAAGPPGWWLLGAAAAAAMAALAVDDLIKAHGDEALVEYFLAAKRQPHIIIPPEDR